MVQPAEGGLAHLPNAVPGGGHRAVDGHCQAQQQPEEACKHQKAGSVVGQCVEPACRQRTQLLVQAGRPVGRMAIDAAGMLVQLGRVAAARSRCARLRAWPVRRMELAKSQAALRPQYSHEQLALLPP